jgi:hypothetical protein
VHKDETRRPHSSFGKLSTCGLPHQALLHNVQDVAFRRHDADHRKCAGVDHDLAVHQYRELAKTPVNHIHVEIKNPAKVGRHTDGLDAGDSNAAVADADAIHGASRSASAR